MAMEWVICGELSLNWTRLCNWESTLSGFLHVANLQMTMWNTMSDYGDIMAEFGTMEGDASRGIKLIMDLVVNHCSHEHPWFVELRGSRYHNKRNFVQ